ncbi:MAG: precorrin-6A reductase [Anaeromicrobium sp.]|jgi:precorrin-6A/cobalt-precorrin-6A reductase|uniref:precorrin-6A reductase n=1 Tax=Anaeromicrobium sp. TaxID=1929132 RepID=UPI0025F33833|nr:precorrin-6A reductase [Anaeromicrobium sp.]MCT4593251.1 precorrin-6A reductase [Anaeromicrobium sp.]
MILVLGGTKDSRNLYEILKKESIPFIFTTATEYGKELVGNKGEHVLSKRLTKEDMISLIKKDRISMVIDTTHPYAAEVSLNAMAACSESHIEYIRFERKEEELSKYESIITYVEDYERAAIEAKKINGNILLTTGSKTLNIFVDKIDKDRLYPRVLPTSSMIKKCEDLGLKACQIIGMQGPFCTPMNEVMIDKYHIKGLVTKDSGKIGGLLEKLEAAHNKNIRVIFIERPKIEYENLYDNMEHLIKKLVK